MSEPQYEYRVVDKEGHFCARWDKDRDGAVADVPRRDESWPSAAPHRIQRRLVSDWEDCPDDA